MLAGRYGSAGSLTPDVAERAAYGGVDPADRTFAFNGATYYGVPGTLPSRTERVEPSFLGYANGGMKGNSVVFSCIRARMSVFSEVSFQWRRMTNGRAGDLFGTKELAPLEDPWPNGTTGDLLARMILDADLAGNSYWTLRNGSLRRLRPDWVYIVRGVEGDQQASADSIESTVIGYIYWPGGFAGDVEPEVLLPEEICHFAPIPDPEASYKGMSWLTPLVREIASDDSATNHKLAFFDNGATLQYVVSYDPTVSIDDVRAMKAAMDERHVGIDNAYKTVHIGGGADITAIGADLRQLDFKQVQGAGETRIAAAAGVPPIIVGLSEGLQAATYSNYAQARRAFADMTVRSLWRNAAASLAALLTVPGGAVLWYDDRDVAFLRDDKVEAAQILQTNASTMQTLINAGFTPESVIKAMVAGGDWSMLTHTGLFSVQLQPPTTPEDVQAKKDAAAAIANGTASPGKAPPGTAVVAAPNGHGAMPASAMNGQKMLASGKQGS